MSTAIGPTRRAPRTILGRGSGAILLAVLAAGVIRFVAVGAFGANGAYPTLQWAAIIASIVVALGAATVLRLVLERLVARPGTIFRRVAVVVYILSLGGPLSVAAGNAQFGPATPTIIVALLLMHTAAALSAFVLLGRGAA